MNLQQFCSKNEFSRPYLEQPFSIGEWTYATNGHICVRVPRVADIPEATEPKVIKSAPALFEGVSADGYKPLPKVEFQDEAAECEECDGRGTEHDCPSCQCKCVWCDGLGEPPKGARTTVGIGAGVYSGQYIAQLMTLPNIVLSEPCRVIKEAGKFKAAYFRFDGGEGCLMTRARHLDNHIDTNEVAA